MNFSIVGNGLSCYEENFSHYNRLKERVEPTKSALRLTGASFLFDDIYIYAFGGRDEETGALSNETYRLSRKDSTTKTKMKVSGAIPPARTGHTCGCFRNRMIILGGIGEKGPLKDVYTLNLANGEWKQRTTLAKPIPLPSCIIIPNSKGIRSFEVNDNNLAISLIDIQKKPAKSTLKQCISMESAISGEIEVFRFDNMSFCIVQGRIFFQKEEEAEFVDVTERIDKDRILSFTRERQIKMKEELLIPLIVSELNGYALGLTSKENAKFLRVFKEGLNTCPALEGDKSERGRSWLGSLLWGGDNESNSAMGNSIKEIGDLFFVYLDVIGGYVRSFTDDDAGVTYNYIENIANVVSFFFNCTADDIHEKSFYAEIFLEDEEEEEGKNSKSEGSRVKKNVDIVDSFWRLDSVDVIYKTVARTPNFEDLPFHYKECFKRICSEIMSGELNTAFEHGSLEPPDTRKYLKTQKKLCAYVKPVVTHTNPLNVVQSLLRYFFFSKVGKRMMKPLFKIDMAKKSIQEFRNANEGVLAELIRISDWLGEKDIFEIRRVFSRISDGDSNKALKSILISDDVVFESEFCGDEEEEEEDSSLECFRKYIELDVLLREKKNLFSLFMDESFQEAILIAIKRLMPLAKLIYGYADVGYLLDVYVRFIDAMIELYDADQEMLTSQIEESERKASWDAGISEIVEVYTDQFYPFYYRLIEGDMKGTRIIPRSVEWISDVQERVEFINMSEFYFMDLYLGEKVTQKHLESAFRRRVTGVMEHFFSELNSL